MNDSELLQAWATQRDETAFAQLVSRYLDTVYAAARRQVGPSPLPGDGTFRDLPGEPGVQASQVVPCQGLGNRFFR